VGERLDSLRPGWFRSPAFRADAFIVAITVLLILFFPLVGAALAAWTAYDRNRSSDVRMRNVALGLLALAVVFLALPELRYGIVFSLTS
jgi:hypothetical protein